MSLISAVVDASYGDNFSPKITTSKNFKHWISRDDSKRCVPCKENHGKIWHVTEKPIPSPPIHLCCRCIIKLMEAIAAGTATINGLNGADWTLKHTGKLPDYYVCLSKAMESGWTRKKWPSNFIPGKIIGGKDDIYQHKNGHLPDAPGRIWYEADINYKSGRRNNQRIVWSNDGLIFVSYDHYQTFYEIT